MKQENHSLHLLAEFVGCRKNRELFTKGEELRDQLAGLVDQSGLTRVGQHFHQFPGAGVTCSILLAESHLNLHSWPERDYLLNIDILVCNFQQDNSGKAHKLYQLLLDCFSPQDVQLSSLENYQPIAPAIKSKAG